ncbi:HNH endonuclease [Tessaracoccus sp. HDW20]|uniref:HNH endonuclease n=1 Tax=Tessaracoccus coleopterorum TaxID=2714950 RepID=UPI0018D3B74D|nr:HNH endonuclease [Tessaracoccus coleopterorum]NHB85216.1 HNH endonuclease [Tessaracoccus coleopterorum]
MSRHSLRDRRWRKVAALVKDRDGHCVTCGSEDDLTVDHVEPMAVLVQRGDLAQAYDPDYLVTLCRSCNSAKQDNVDGRPVLVHPDYADILQLPAAGFF